MKIKIGVVFGGKSREREISFAGGRTVYDNLNKSIFEAVPIFVDSFGNFVLLDWQYIYKGSIRDFYPPVDMLPHSPNGFQIYAESLGELTKEQQSELINKIGKKIHIEDLKEHIDFAFLCLHGSYGEDGRIQGLLEYFGIPYSGSGILSSGIGIDKIRQKELMINADFNVPEFNSMPFKDWYYFDEKERQGFFEATIGDLGLPIVIKPATQGSSVGVTILKENNFKEYNHAMNKAFFIEEILRKDWIKKDAIEKVNYLKTLTDIRDGIGMPVLFNDDEMIYHPEELLKKTEEYFENGKKKLSLYGMDSESIVIMEEFINGKEFSCIVIEDEAEGIALPPTQIIKGKELFDYRSKYLPGLSRKITPIAIPEEQITDILDDCENLFLQLFFDVYARIDGFIDDDGTIFLNDPNTTSGMMPSSFFFHQAAEIGLNPSQFLTYIIQISLVNRIQDLKDLKVIPELLNRLDVELVKTQSLISNKIKIAVILGGYSSERHISVESGRNVYEKLASSEKYEPIPIFLTGNGNGYELYKIPINILLKDNADDIKEKVRNFKRHEIVDEIIEKCADITEKYASASNLDSPTKITFKELAKMVDGVFIALHGRPGEDGTIQAELEKVSLPYNGSSPATSHLTINKFQTNQLLNENGFSIAKHLLIHHKDWELDSNKMVVEIKQQFTFPFIAKPVDDGCSSAVKKIRNEEELIAYSDLIFRKQEKLNPALCEKLHLNLKEEFPMKNVYLIEELIAPNGAKHFLEITGGLLTHFNDGKIEYEIFEASEALSEGDVLSLEEKFLAGEGQNITPARYSKDADERAIISQKVKDIFLHAANVLNIEGYARIDAFVRIFDKNEIEVIFIEVNSLPGMTPATCIFHQCAINGYKPYEFVDKILDYGFEKSKKLQHQTK